MSTTETKKIAIIGPPDWFYADVSHYVLELTQDAVILEIRSLAELKMAIADPEVKLIFSDWMNDWCNGIDVLSLALIAGNAEKVIIASSIGDEEIAADVLKAGGGDYVIRTAGNARLQRIVRERIGDQESPSPRAVIERVLAEERMALLEEQHT